MASIDYFRNFPGIVDKNGILLTDITLRVKIRDTWLNNSRLYYPYEYQDSDRPEEICEKYYGDKTLGWLLFMTNNIFDPFFEFPMSTEIFTEYLNDKYAAEGEEIGRTGYEYAQLTNDPVKQYQKIVSTAYPDGTTSSVYHIIDQESFTDLADFSETITDPVSGYVTYSIKKRLPLVTIFDVEFEANQAKRNINILKKEYIPQARKELRALIGL